MSRISILEQIDNAIYKEAISKIEYGNPFNEALPVPDEAFETLKNSFCIHQFSDRVKNASINEKRVYLYEIEFFLSPFGIYARMLEFALSALKGRYAKKNPLDPKVRLEMLKKVYGEDNFEDISSFAGKCSEPVITVIGTPGMGKTTLVSTVMGCLPQLIVHDNYHGFPMEHHAQIVYLKIDAPVDGKCITLCKDIFKAIDVILRKANMKATYYNQFANTSKSSIEMLNQLNILVDQLGIGLIVIDEIQRIVTLDQEREELINFIMNFSNISQLPIVLVGTNDAEQLFKNKFFMARRGLSKKIVMSPFNENDKDWKVLVDQMWKMQLLDNIVEITDEIRSTLYKYSGGITAVLVLLFRFSQRNALLNKLPLDAEIIRKTALTELKELTKIVLNKKKYSSKKFSDLLNDAKRNWDNEKEKEKESQFVDTCIQKNKYENDLIAKTTIRIIEDKMFDRTDLEIKKVVTEIYDLDPFIGYMEIQKKAIKKLFEMEERAEIALPDKSVQKRKKTPPKDNSEIIENIRAQKAPLFDFK